MKAEDLAFMNRQLAGMLDSGIPLEGSLRQLCREMSHGRLREELAALEKDLAQGRPIDEALAGHKLPELYVKMMRAGIKGNNLPAMLSLLADYYQQQHTLWARLKGILFYPVLVLAGSLCLSALCAVLFSSMIHQMFSGFPGIYDDMLSRSSLPAFTQLLLSHHFLFSAVIWTPAIAAALMAVVLLVLFGVPFVRRRLRFRLPVLKDASLAQFAFTMGLMLKGGCPLGEAVGFTRQMEEGTPLGTELERWEKRLREGQGTFEQMTASSDFFPPLFKWLVGGAGERMAEGFDQAAELYGTRSQRERDFTLNAILPAATIALGIVIAIQVYCLFATIVGLFLPFITLMDKV